jgi:hypothetical protein
MLSIKSSASFAALTLIAVLALALLQGIALTQTRSNKRVRNYDECIRAGYWTGKDEVGREKCVVQTPYYGLFFKGLKPTIRQGVYGTVTLITGNCMPTTVRPGLGDILSMLFTGRSSCHYEVVNRSRIYVFANTPFPAGRIATEVFLKSHNPVSFVDMKNGFYEVPLAAGEYLFGTEDDGELYPRWPIIVEPGELTEMQLTVKKAAE